MACRFLAIRPSCTPKSDTQCCFHHRAFIGHWDAMRMITASGHLHAIASSNYLSFTPNRHIPGADPSGRIWPCIWPWGVQPRALLCLSASTIRHHLGASVTRDAGRGEAATVGWVADQQGTLVMYTHVYNHCTCTARRLRGAAQKPLKKRAGRCPKVRCRRKKV